jgi:hypothetical protein
MHQCLICGFPEMPYAPIPFNVCPCCGTEFGVDDRKTRHATLRAAWINAGKPWFDDITSPSKDWNPDAQLVRAGFVDTRPFTITGERSENSQESISVTRPLWNRQDLQRLNLTSSQIQAV